MIREKTNKRHLSLLASLSFHCQYIPPTIHVARTIHYKINKSVWWSIYIYTVHTNICVYPPPDIVLSKRPKPSMVAVSCDGVCVLLSSPIHNWMECFKSLHSTQGRYSRYTPCQVESIFSVSSGVSSFDFHLFVNKEHLRYFQDDTDVLPAP